MLTLHGFSTSQYYNKVKFALLEKGLPFREQLVWTGEADLARSPLGKVPYLDTPHGPLCESAVILDYLEQEYPKTPLLPSDAYQAAKVRELAGNGQRRCQRENGAAVGKERCGLCASREFFPFCGRPCTDAGRLLGRRASASDHCSQHRRLRQKPAGPIAS